jgi:hypothetical protein
MSVATKAAQCTSCGKRLNRKSWYYRNGKYFCKRRCWDTEAAKMAKESKEKAAKADADKAEKAEKEKAEKAKAAEAAAPATESEVSQKQ